jgi:arrestin-related trafficking adapter 1
MDALKEIKRHSIGGRHGSHEKKSPKVEPEKSVKLSVLVESPPLVFYGTVANSTGALFSASINAEAKQAVTVESFTAEFICTTTTKKPVHHNCPECTVQQSSLKQWTFVGSEQGPLRLTPGLHPFPLSYLIPGHLPASTNGSLAVISYHLNATVKTSLGETVTFTKPVEIKRAIIAGNPKHSLRIFPPTNLTAQLELPPVIHPIGQFNIEMRLAGVTSRQKDAQVRWRLRKLMWRIEERQKMVSPACPKHASKLGGEGKGIQHEDMRIVGSDDLKSGWKSNFDDGVVELEFQIAVNPSLKPVCNVDAPNGLKIDHFLVLEMIVAEEWSPYKRPSQVTPTGAARVLRTQFHMQLTERSGLGIAWDEEQPPMYEDVPESPPAYVVLNDFNLQDLSDEEEGGETFNLNHSG